MLMLDHKKQRKAGALKKTVSASHGANAAVAGKATDQPKQAGDLKTPQNTSSALFKPEKKNDACADHLQFATDILRDAVKASDGAVSVEYFSAANNGRDCLVIALYGATRCQMCAYIVRDTGNGKCPLCGGSTLPKVKQDGKKTP